jgi:hypothetical protein
MRRTLIDGKEWRKLRTWIIREFRLLLKNIILERRIKEVLPSMSSLSTTKGVMMANTLNREMMKLSAELSKEARISTRERTLTSIF